MIGEKWLSNVIFTTVASQADISRVKKGVMGDFQVGSLSRAVNTEEVNEITVRAWLARANARKSTLVFCVDLAHVSDLAAKFRAHGVDAQFVTGDTPTQVRSQRLDAFRNRDYPVLLNCGVFTEGTDIPNIDCVLLARPTRSRNLLVQMIGRGMRLHPGKTNCHVIDMVASLGVGIVTTPALFGLDPAELVEETDPEGLKALKERKSLEEVNRQPKSIAARPSMPGNKSVTFTDYDSVHDMIDDMSSEGQIRRMSMLSWVLVGHERYVLPVQTGDYLTIETAKDSDKRYRVMITQKLSGSTSESSSRGSPYMRPRQIALSETLPDAIHAADTFAVQKYSWRLLGHSRPWRKGRATEGQMSYINKFRDADNQLRPEDISKGEAGDMITKIRFGARARFHKLEAARKRALRAHEQMSEIASMRQGEQVAVGPISKTRRRCDSRTQEAHRR
jgi:ATP-dependent helicase IRC3